MKCRILLASAVIAAACIVPFQAVSASAANHKVCFSGNLGLIPDGETTGFLFGGGLTPRFLFANLWSAGGLAGHPYHLIIDDKNYKTSNWANIASNSTGGASKSTAFNYSRDVRVHNNDSVNNSSIGVTVEGTVGAAHGAPCSVGSGS
jgi:hypothetical protein